MGDRNRGIYQKFNVERTDGKSAPGQKHHNCFYFVLDCDHDPHAKAALEAYARSCKHEYPTLASDVQAIVQGCAFGSGEDKHVSDVLTIPPYSAPETPAGLGFGIPFLMGMVKERMQVGESREEAITKVAEHAELRSDAIAALRSALNR